MNFPGPPPEIRFCRVPFKPIERPINFPRPASHGRSHAGGTDNKRRVEYGSRVLAPWRLQARSLVHPSETWSHPRGTLGRCHKGSEINIHCSKNYFDFFIYSIAFNVPILEWSKVSPPWKYTLYGGFIGASALSSIEEP